MPGRLLYLMGASGSGKDTVLQGVKSQLGSKIHIAPRIITRPGTATEQHAISVTPAQFQTMHAQGMFAMAWHANSLSYGIHRNIRQHLASGCDVMVNGSRAYLPHACHEFPELQPIMLHVETEVLEQRLMYRGRENGQQIQARLARNNQFSQLNVHQTHNPIITIDNSGPARHAIAALCDILEYRVYNSDNAVLSEQHHT